MAELLRTEIKGAKELNATIKKLPRELQQRVYLQSLRKGANVFRDGAVQSAPISREYSRARSFTKGNRTMLIKLRNEIRATVTKKTDISFQILIHCGRAFWGMFLEFGTFKMPARPWMRPSYERDKVEALKVTGESLGKGVEATAKRLAGPLARSGLLRRR